MGEGRDAARRRLPGGEPGAKNAVDETPSAV